VVRITEFSLNEYFHDTQKQGPFRRWEHTHSFEPMMQAGMAGTLLRDEVEYDVGFGMVGRALESAVFQQVFRSTFNYRKRMAEQIFPSPAAVTAGS
jgi:ligand-binding SRPBCC domain-containing protein